MTLQGVLKNGKYHEMGLKLRYMTLSSIVTLQKKFSFMRCTFLEAYLFQIFRYTFSKCFFTKQDVLKNGKCHEIAKNSEYMNSTKIIALLKKFFLCELEPFWSLLSKKHRYTYSKSIFTLQGVLEMDNAMKWAKHWNIWHWSL